jgi:hypothetical protein
VPCKFNMRVSVAVFARNMSSSLIPSSLPNHGGRAAAPF